MASQCAQMDPKYTETDTTVTFDGKNDFDNGYGTNKYNYIWLTGEEKYNSDNEDEREVETKARNINEQNKETQTNQLVTSCPLCELEQETSNRDGYFNDEVIVLDEEIKETEGSSNTIIANAELEDEGCSMYPYSYVLLSDHEDLEETNVDSTVTSKSEKEVVYQEVASWISNDNPITSLEMDKIQPVSCLKTCNNPPVSSSEMGNYCPDNILKSSKSQPQLVEPDSTTSVQLPAVGKAPEAVGLFGLPAGTVADIVHRLWKQAKIREATDVPGSNREINVDDNQAKQTASDQSELPVKDTAMPEKKQTGILKKRGRKPVKTYKINRNKILSPKRTFVIKTGRVLENKRHPAKVRKRKSKNADMLMQDAEKYLSMCGVAETTSASIDGHDNSQLGRTSKRLAGKQKVNYHELVQGSNSNTSSSRCSILSDESFEEGLETFCYNEHGHRHSKSLTNFPSESNRNLNEKWKKLMPTPTSMRKLSTKRYVNVNETQHGIMNNKQASKPSVEVAASAGSNERQRNHSRGSNNESSSLTSSPEPRVVLDKLKTQAWIENHTIAQNTLQRQIERVEKANMDERYNDKGRRQVTRESVCRKLKKMKANRFKQSLLAVTKKISASDPDFLPKKYPRNKSVRKKYNCRKARKGLNIVQTLSSISVSCKNDQTISACSKTMETNSGSSKKGEMGKKFYPCKYCGRSYSRPYIYAHQAAHRRKRERARLGLLGHVRGGSLNNSPPARLNCNKLVEQKQGHKTSVTPSSSPCVRTPVRKPKVLSLVSSRTHSCSKCKYKANTLQLLRDHSLVHQLKGSSVITCELCNIVFKSHKAFKIWHTKNKRNHTYQKKNNSKATNSEVARQYVKKDKGTAYSNRYSSMEQIDNTQASTRPILPLVSVIEGSNTVLDANANKLGTDTANQDIGTSYAAEWVASNANQADNNSNWNIDNVNKNGRETNTDTTAHADVKEMDSKTMNKVTGPGFNNSDSIDGKVDENANITSGSKTPVSSLSCVSCNYVSDSYEDLGSHFIANHFPGQGGGTDASNNAEELVSNVQANSFDSINENNDTGFKCVGNVAGGFAKKYRAKKQKQVYAFFNKQLLLDNQAPMPLDNTQFFGKSVNASGTWYPTESGKTSLDYENNNNSIGIGAKMSNRNKNVRKKSSKGAKSDLNNNVETEPLDRTSKAKRYSRLSKRAELESNKAAETETSEGIKPSGSNNEDLDGTRSECSSITVEMLTCLVCQTSFSVKADLMKHLSRIHRITNLCQLCYFREGQIMRFANPVSLRNHKLRCHPDDMVKCVCGAMLIDKKMLTSHLRKFRCEQTGPENLGQPEMVKCVCGKRFGSSDLLAVHKMKCRKRSHSEGSDSSSLSSLNPSLMMVGRGKGVVASPAFNTRSLEMKMEDEAGGSGFADDNTPGWGLVQKRHLRDRKPIQYNSMMELKESPIAPPPSPLADRIAQPKNKQSTGKDNPFDIVKSEGPLPVKSLKSRQKGKTGKTKPSSTKSSANGCTSPQPVASSSKTPAKKAKTTEPKTQKKKSGRRNNRPDADGRYPCKTCRRRFKRPYLYVHQKTVHARKQWVWMPAARPKKGGDSGLKYRCGWCKFVAIHWRTVIRHHYSCHGEMELDVVAMVTKPTGAATQQWES